MWGHLYTWLTFPNDVWREPLVESKEVYERQEVIKRE